MEGQSISAGGQRQTSAQRGIDATATGYPRRSEVPAPQLT